MCVIIFFFKQKTAYEMRISDWSSDVCSSDLATPASNTADKYGHGTILRDARHPRAKLTPDGVRHIRSSGRSSRVMAEEFGVSLSVIKAVRSGQSWKSVIRSEEHTSELQSLMRISYAVFCLKKKNTTEHK